MLITIDTSVFISRLSGLEEGHGSSRRFLQALPGRPVIVVLPTLVRPEISGAMRRRTGSVAVAGKSLGLLDLLPNLNLITLDERLAAEAAAVAAAGGLKGSDAVFVAVAQRFDAILVSLDRHQRLHCPASVRALTPEEAADEVEGLT